jgi:uridine phosphorylase
MSETIEGLKNTVTAMMVGLIILAVVATAFAGLSARYKSCYAQAAVIAEDSMNLTDQLASDVMDGLDDILLGRYTSNDSFYRIGSELQDNRDELAGMSSRCNR